MFYQQCIESQGKVRSYIGSGLGALTPFLLHLNLLPGLADLQLHMTLLFGRQNIRVAARTSFLNSDKAVQKQMSNNG